MYKIKELDVNGLGEKDFHELYKINKVLTNKYNLIDLYNTPERFNTYLSRFKEPNKLFVMENNDVINGILTFSKQNAWDGTDQYVLEASFVNKNIDESIIIEVEKLVEALSKAYSPIALDTYNYELEKVAKSFNGKVRLRAQCFTLKKEDINLKKLNNTIKKLEDKNRDLTLECFVNVPEEYIGNYCKLFMEGTADMPDVKEEGFVTNIITPEFIKDLKERCEKNNSTHHCCLVLNSNKEVVGMSNIMVNNNDPRYPYQFMITAKREYRGRCIGKWMYANLYKKLYETVDFEKTHLYHHPTNKPAIDVSEATGYKKAHIKITYILPL